MEAGTKKPPAARQAAWEKGQYWKSQYSTPRQYRCRGCGIPVPRGLCHECQTWHTLLNALERAAAAAREVRP